MQPRHIVGVGASAGGLEALQQLLQHLPADSPDAFIVLQHLAANRESHLAEILGRASTLPVITAANGQELRAGTVHVVPAGFGALYQDGRIALEPAEAAASPKPSISAFLISLAQAAGARGAGIILSGTGNDGLAGLRALRGAGALTIAQRPETARYDGMPRSAIDAGVVDYMLAPEQIGPRLDRLLAATEGAELGAIELEQVLSELRERTDFDFTGYKPATLRRRLRRRMHLLGYEDVGSYLEGARQSPQELATLARELLVSVTAFFRDADAFAALATAIAQLCARRAGAEIRAWVAGCATGEEAYSIAMLVAEALGEAALATTKVQIFATDIDEDALWHARRGVYPTSALKDVPSALVQRYFSPSGPDSREVTKELRDRVIFTRHDVVADPPFLRLDLISCRNVFIYFNANLQTRALSKFHFGLRDGGLLLLGRSEHPGGPDSAFCALFGAVDRKARLFMKGASVSSSPATEAGSVPVARERIQQAHPSAPRQDRQTETVLLSATTAMCGITAMLCTPEGRVLQQSGDLRAVLGGVPAPGAVIMLPQACDPALRSEVATLMQRAAATGVPQSGARRRLGELRLRVHVAPVSAGASRWLAVAFAPVVEIVAGADATQPGAIDAAGGGAYFEAMQDELKLAHQQLEELLIEVDAGRNTSSAMQQEVQVANAEMQAANEELETANEEMQAANEELLSLNAELHARTTELTRISAEYAHLYDTLDFPVMVFDRDLGLTRCNLAAGRSLGVRTSTMRQVLPALKLSRTPLGAEIERLLRQAQASGEPTSGMALQGRRTHSVAITPAFDPSGVVLSYIVAAVDVTDITLAHEQLRLTARVFDEAGEAILVMDTDGVVQSVNRAFTAVVGSTPEDVVGHSNRVLRSSHHDERFYESVWSTVRTQGTWQGELWLSRDDGTEFPAWITVTRVDDEAGRAERIVSVFSNITSLKETQRRVEYLATHDTLTGLANRALFIDHLHLEIAAARRARTRVALMFVDLDRFKTVNDTLGHEAGDHLLKLAAERMGGVVREVDTLARLAGDEFTLVLPAATVEAATEIGSRLLKELARPFDLDAGQAFASGSIGVAFFPEDAADATDLIKAADGAMYRAKDLGRNRLEFFRAEVHAQNLQRAAIERALCEALRADRLRVVFQPQLSLQRGRRVIGVEALVRWNDPVLGEVSPADFIPIAERIGLIGEVTRRVLDVVLKESIGWRAAGLPCPRIAVNVSPRDLREPGFAAMMLAKIDASGVPHEAVAVELTEGAVMERTEAVIANLHALGERGVRSAVDDFGTGYSSLSYLKRMPLAELKIDRSFVAGLGVDPSDEAIARSVLALAHALDLRTVAEGVESEKQLKWLARHGCDAVQGFLLCEPLERAQFRAYLTEQTATKRWKKKA